MSDTIKGRYYSAQRGLFPTLLPNSWWIIKTADPSVHFEMWGRENTEQAIAWLDEREAERQARLTEEETTP
jgi:hypothetical protein